MEIPNFLTLPWYSISYIVQILSLLGEKTRQKNPNIPFSLIYFSVSVINIMAKRNSGRKGFFHLTAYSPSLREFRIELETGTWKRELKKSWRRAAYWLAVCGSLTVFLYNPLLPGRG